jgi:hypothetical protein
MAYLLARAFLVCHDLPDRDRDRHALIEGFSHFVTSMTAPIASGWSVRRVGIPPTGKRRLVTAHTPDICASRRMPATFSHRSAVSAYSSFAKLRYAHAA